MLGLALGPLGWLLVALSKPTTQFSAPIMGAVGMVVVVGVAVGVFVLLTG